MRYLILLIALSLTACANPPKPPPDISSGYAADQHDGIIAPGGVAPLPGDRQSVALFVVDDWGDCDELSQKFLDGVGEWSSRIQCRGTNSEDSGHGVMVLSEAMKAMRGLDPNLFYIELYGFLNDNSNDSLSKIIQRREDLLSQFDFVVEINSWGMPRGIYSDDDSQRIFRNYVGGTLQQLRANPNLFIVFAAGNEGPERAGYPQSMLNDTPAVVVGASNPNGTTADFTSWDDSVDVTGHGVKVQVFTHEGKWAEVAGTSFSCPLTAGWAAATASRNPGVSRDDLLEMMSENLETDEGVSYPNPVIGMGDVTNYRQAQRFEDWGPGLGRRLWFSVTPVKKIDLPQPRLSP